MRGGRSFEVAVLGVSVLGGLVCLVLLGDPRVAGSNTGSLIDLLRLLAFALIGLLGAAHLTQNGGSSGGGK